MPSHSLQRPDAPQRRGHGLGLCALTTLLVLAGCTTAPPKSPPVSTGTAPSPTVQEPEPTVRSQARTPKEYRRDAANHLYQHQSARIFQGRLPPLLYAVGVLNVDIDRRGQVTDVRWMRAPQHAPEVMAQIEQMVRAAAPYPAPQHMAHVTYTDVWLWHRSGRFQLDTLTEGQD